jgi:cytochrome c oxidase subunit 3
MMFAGLTSAYLVKGSLPGWASIELPRLFYFSTGIMLLSSLTMQLSVKSFRERNGLVYRRWMTVTFLLGVTFILMQVFAFYQLYGSGIRMEGSGAGQFLYIIFGLHALHVLGGVIALLVLFLKAFSSNVRVYNAVPLEIAALYWHFVDVLWVYLFVFFMMQM